MVSSTHLFSISLNYKETLLQSSFHIPQCLFHTHKSPFEANEHSEPEDILGMGEEGRERKERIRVTIC